MVYRQFGRKQVFIIANFKTILPTTNDTTLQIIHILLHYVEVEVEETPQ